MDFLLHLFVNLTVGWLTKRPFILMVFFWVWVLLLVFLLLGWTRQQEFRCTFLAVGHGGSAVVETADGRVLLYDAGSIGGPDVRAGLSLHICGGAATGKSTT